MKRNRYDTILECNGMEQFGSIRFGSARLFVKLDSMVLRHYGKVFSLKKQKTKQK